MHACANASLQFDLVTLSLLSSWWLLQLTSCWLLWPTFCDKEAVNIAYSLPEGRPASSEPASPHAIHSGWSQDTPPHPPADPADTAPIKVLLAVTRWAGTMVALAPPAQRNTGMFDKTEQVQLSTFGFSFHQDVMWADSASAKQTDGFMVVVDFFRWIVKVPTWD